MERILSSPAAGAAPLWNTERVSYLLRIFGHPERCFFPVLIAGTKGKGSTGFFLEAILRRAGISTGFYSSPHLETPLERIRLDGGTISPELWTKGLSEIRSALIRNPVPRKLGQLTYFELMTFLAIFTFAKKKVGVGIFEAGMGGRLDATNALDARVAVITTIGLDHEAFLGNTIEKIAREKAGIIKQGADVVTVPKPEPAFKVVRAEAKRRKAALHGPAPLHDAPLGLKGEFQKLNAGLAIRAACLLAEKYSFPVTDAAIREGLKAGDWPGRMETFRRKCDIMLDGAHNPSSAEALTRSLKKEFPRRHAVLVFGAARDKNSKEMLRVLSGYFREIVLTKSASARSQDLNVLIEQARGLFQRVYPEANTTEAVSLAESLSPSDGLVVVTGSFYVLGEVRAVLKNKKRS